eukprot:scaffold118275_cov51-Phaeocystis_antarctica.AAC.3
MPNLPSPTTATLAAGPTSCCSTMRNAAASGSANAAFSVLTPSGTTCRLATGRVSRSWGQPRLVRAVLRYDTEHGAGGAVVAGTGAAAAAREAGGGVAAHEVDVTHNALAHQRLVPRRRALAHTDELMAYDASEAH